MQAVLYSAQDRKKELQEKILSDGVQSLTDHELLELFLLYTTPKSCDSGKNADSLLSEYKSLYSVFSDGNDSLASMIGNDQSGKMFFRFLPDLARLYYVSKKPASIKLPDTASVIEYLKDFFIGRYVEATYLLLLNQDKKLICNIKMAEGLTDSVAVDLKSVAHHIAETDAVKYVILAHNHPNYRPFPSTGDVKVTKKVADIADSVDAALIDHIIFSPYGNFSMAEHKDRYGFLFPR